MVIDKVEAARQAWNRACGVWSRDDGKDAILTVQRGEQMMFAATDLICALEDALADQAGR